MLKCLDGWNTFKKKQKKKHYLLEVMSKAYVKTKMLLLFYLFYPLHIIIAISKLGDFF